MLLSRMAVPLVVGRLVGVGHVLGVCWFCFADNLHILGHIPWFPVTCLATSSDVRQVGWYNWCLDGCKLVGHDVPGLLVVYNEVLQLLLIDHPYTMCVIAQTLTPTILASPMMRTTPPTSSRTDSLLFPLYIHCFSLLCFIFTHHLTSCSFI